MLEQYAVAGRNVLAPRVLPELNRQKPWGTISLGLMLGWCRRLQYVVNWR